MKMLRTAVLACSFVASAAATAAPVLIDFEKPWDYLAGDIDGYYGGGRAADGTSGPNLGATFVNVSGLSNDPSFAYYSSAPSPVGVAYAHTAAVTDAAFLNFARGIARTMSFFYSSPGAAPAALRAYSGLNGTGTLLGTLNLAANTTGGYDVWTPITFAFAGIAQSIDLTGSANLVALDNVSLAIPEPAVGALGALGIAALLAIRRRPRGIARA